MDTRDPQYGSQPPTEPTPHSVATPISNGLVAEPAPQPAAPRQEYPAPLAATGFSQSPYADTPPPPGPAVAAPYSTQSEQIAQEPDTPEFSWTASEFIAHHKTSSWYLALAAGIAFGSLFVYLVTRDWFSTVAVVVAAAAFAVFANRQPRELNYVMGGRFLAIGEKLYAYKDYRSFSLVNEGHFSSITFMPLKRFSPPLSIFYHPDDEDRIIELLARHLPMQEHRHDMTESLMRRIRF